jgi:hypothetical protein
MLLITEQQEINMFATDESNPCSVAESWYEKQYLAEQQVATGENVFYCKSLLLLNLTEIVVMDKNHRRKL